MKKQLIIIGLHVLFLAEVSYAGPRCFDCQRRPEARDCDHVTRCGDHEVCHVMQLVSDSGNVYYDVGCVDRLRCNTKRSPLLSGILEEENGDIVTCASCCDGDFCNSDGCGSQPLAALLSGRRGPICFTCPHGQITPEQCDKVTVCGRDQSCYIRPVIGFGGDQLSASGCTTACSAGSVLVGRRNIATCEGCCHGDFCNMNCSDIQATHNVHSSSTSTMLNPTRATSAAFTSSLTQAPTTPAFHQVDYEKLCLMFGYTYLPQYQHCYKIYSEDKVTWTEARRRCKHDNGDLFMLHNKDEEKLIESLTEPPTDAWDTKRYWIGASDIEHEGQWVWVDETPVHPQYFYPTEPNNGRNGVDENCGALSFINKTFLLNDDVCGNVYHFICEIDLKDPTPFLSKDTSTGCRNSYYTYETTNGICYKVYDTTKATMNDARALCQNEGADLLQLRNLDVENVFLHSGSIDKFSQDKRYWLGVTRQDDDEFYWLNGHLLVLGDYMWAEGQPDNYQNQEKCVDLANVGTFALNDDNCDKHNNFICEESCPNREFSYVPMLNMCIKVFSQDVTWGQAEAECRRQSSDLAEPDTVDKTLFLDWFLDNFNLNRYWVGARQTGPNNTVFWQVSNKRVLNELWSTRQPNLTNSCVVIHRSSSQPYYGLEGQDCNTQNEGFICQHVW